MLKRIQVPIYALALALSAVVFTPVATAKTSHAVTKSSSAKVKASKKNKKAVQKKRIRMAPTKPSVGQMAGLHRSDDELSLRSSVAYVIDQDTQ